MLTYKRFIRDYRYVTIMPENKTAVVRRLK